jgi:hypothetical protein
VESPLLLGTGLPFSGPQEMTGTSPTKPAQALRHSVERIAPGNTYSPATTQIFSVNPTREPEDPVPVRLHQQTPTIVAGPKVYLPTPPMGTDTLPDGFPHPPLLRERKRSPQRVSQKRRLGLQNPPTTLGTSPRCAAQQPLSHPYPRPAKVRR